jgi:5-methylcytosine-specific restriction endonuclease McrA
MDHRLFETWEEFRLTSNRCLTNTSSLTDINMLREFAERLQRCDKEIEPFLEQKDLIPNIIVYLKKFYTTRLWSADKEYLDKRISDYESALPVCNARPSLLEDRDAGFCGKRKRKKKQYISAALKLEVWVLYFGESVGKAKCVCCKRIDILQASFHCGHVVAEANGGETIASNLRPICQRCNSSMGTKHMDVFMSPLHR